MYDPLQDAAEVSDVINTYGNTITFPGAVAMKAIIDERPDELARSVPQDVYDSLEGRPGLFYVSAADGELIPAGALFDYDGQKWKMHPLRPFTAADTRTMVAFLATAGAVE
jgi:hypothetical protein